MKSSAIILACLACGIVVGTMALLPNGFLDRDPVLYALDALLLLIGIEIGASARVWQVAKSHGIKVLLVPLSAIVGTLLGVSLSSLLVPGIGFKGSLAVGAGFGYYTLASVLITEIGGKTLGVVALLSNIIRELATLLAAPLLARYFGRLAPIVSGGATAMDTTLPIITRSVGNEYAVVSVVSGLVLTLLAPVLITVILR